MKKILLVLLVSIQVFAQTGIGTTTPNASAKLDVYATNKGFLPPRLTLTSATDATTIASPAEGLLVYNLGSVGLQAGYYYWNGANWATIATATSAGNGVTSMDMVKLYSKGYSTAAGDIANASGYSFTVPVSGRYLFDFSSTGFSNATITYKVRLGTTDISTDAQTSVNNSVHVEYNGKVEVNLQAGTTYNVIVTTTGSRDSGDYDRVYYKMVAGNLPVTGQTVDYAMASLSANQTIAAVGNVLFNTIQGAGITLNNGGFNLIANKTYKLEAAVGGSSTGYIYYAWVDASNTIISGGSVGSVMKAGAAFTDGPQDKAVAYYTPTANTTVYLRVLSISGSSVAYTATGTPAFSSTWASIAQIGSSAIINPWTLSGNNTYNTTGKVGIGNTAPNATLDVRTTPTSTTDPGAGYIGVGTTTTTASTAGAGAIRYNTTSGLIEFSNGSSWQSLAPGNTPMYAQFSSNAVQYFNAIGTKMLFQVTNINVGSMSNSSNGTIYLPAGRVYRVDLNLGWANVGWSRFAIYNASSGAQLSQTAHVEGGSGYYIGTGITSCFINTSSGAINIEARFVAPLNSNSLFGDTGNGGNYPSLTIQTVD
jgi:hypothetical protein